VDTTQLLSADVEHFVAVVPRHFTDLDPRGETCCSAGRGRHLRPGDGAGTGRPRRSGRVRRGAAGGHRARADLVPSSPGAPPGVRPAGRGPGPLVAAALALAGRPGRSACPAPGVVGRPGLLDGDARERALVDPAGAGRALPADEVGGGWLIVLEVNGLVSVQVGRWVLRPGTRSAVARLVLLGPNLFALAVLPHTVQNLEYTTQTQYVDDLRQGLDAGGVTLDGEQMCNLQPYDADGRPPSGYSSSRSRAARWTCATPTATAPAPTRGCSGTWPGGTSFRRPSDASEATTSWHLPRPGPRTAGRPRAGRTRVPHVAHPLRAASAGDRDAGQRR
jgi:hypothetical protein